MTIQVQLPLPKECAHYIILQIRKVKEKDSRNLAIARLARLSAKEAKSAP